MLDTMEVEADQEWRPPSEAQLKIEKARRERSDKISKIMGDYLLKGYKMLGTVCDDCGTILLKTPQGINYCIACSELDSDNDKDNPVMSASAALSKVSESRHHAPPSNPLQTPWLISGGDASRPLHRADPLPSGTAGPQTQGGAGMAVVESASGAEACGVLQEKLAWATRELSQASSVEYCTQLCLLIKACADAIASLRQMP